MRRICVSAFLLGVLCVAASADPMPIAPGAYIAAFPPGGSQQQQTPTAGQAAAYASAAQPNYGGGFIEFLFGGAPPATRQPAYQPAPAAYQPAPPPQSAALPGNADGDDAVVEGEDQHPPVDPKFDRQEVSYDTKEPAGTIVIDTPHKFLYLVEGDGKALRYGIGVGRPGFTWAGSKAITAKREWPDWRPPEAMLKRQPELPRFMAGGPQNPLGARAMYLGSTDYRIHGSNEPWTIGHNVSSGCIRLRNADVIDLYNRVKVGTKVVVM